MLSQPRYLPLKLILHRLSQSPILIPLKYPAEYCQLEPSTKSSENNMFFDKPWSEVSESELDEQAEKLSNELGGWVFHDRVDFSRPTPWLTLDVTQPAVMLDDTKGTE